MNRFLIITILAPIFFFGSISCESVSEKPQVESIQEEITSSRYGATKIEFPRLSERVRAQIAMWTVFEDFEDEATTISGSTLGELRVKTERLLLHADSLSKKIPDTLNTNLINSRLMVVRTRANLLHQEVHRPRIDSAKIVDHIDELNQSVIILLEQLNEKFQKDAIDEQRKDDEKKELEKQKRFLDSVYKAELLDNN